MTKIRRYLVFTFIASWIIQISGARDMNLGSTGGMVSFSQPLIICMLMPSLGALIAGARFRDMGWNPEPKQNLRPILFAWLAPTVLQIAGAALYFLVFPSGFDLSGAFLNERNHALGFFKE